MKKIETDLIYDWIIVGPDADYIERIEAVANYLEKTGISVDSAVAQAYINQQKYFDYDPLANLEDKPFSDITKAEIKKIMIENK